MAELNQLRANRDIGTARRHIKQFVSRHPVPVWGCVGAAVLFGVIEAIAHGTDPVVQFVTSSPVVEFALESAVTGGICGVVGGLLTAFGMVMAYPLRSYSDYHERRQRIDRRVRVACGTATAALALTALAVATIGGDPSWTQPVATILGSVAAMTAGGWVSARILTAHELH